MYNQAGILGSISENNIPSYAPPHQNGSRLLLACPHSGSAYPTRPVCILHIQFSRYTRQLALADRFPLPVLDKIIRCTCQPKKHISTPVCYERFCKDYVLYRNDKFIFPVYRVRIYGLSVIEFSFVPLLHVRTRHAKFSVHQWKGYLCMAYNFLL